MLDLLEPIWDFLNSPAGITLVAGVVLALLNKLYAGKPAWQKFEGAIIEACKYAEKIVPNETENKGLQRLDEALKYVERIYYEVKGVAPTGKVQQSLKEGIRIKHAELEAAGTLGKSPPPAEITS